MADGFIYTQPAYDMADYLPAPAADRLRDLRQRISDKRALAVPFEKRHAASTERFECEARLKRLQDRRSNGGFELADDDPSVLVEKKRLGALTAESRRLNDLDTVRSTQWREAGYVLANIEAWLRDGQPPGTKLDVCETAVPSLPKGQSLTAAIEIRERRIRELQAEARRVEASPFPAAYARQRMREKVTTLAARGAPSVARLIQKSDGDIEFAEASHLVPVMGRTDASIAGWQQSDAFLLTCFLNRDALIKALDAEISAVSDDAHAMTVEQREKATATIMSQMLACDRELSELIWLAQAQNLPVEFRPDANPLAVLGLALVTTPHTARSGTSPGHAYDIVGPQ
jgi:hypothetical protein